jgi:hypothetical protein
MPSPFFESRPLDDADFSWHLKTGQYIFGQGEIPKTDFSFTNYGKRWVAHEMAIRLSEVIFYLQTEAALLSMKTPIDDVRFMINERVLTADISAR